MSWATILSGKAWEIKVKFVQEILAISGTVMILEEKFTTCFDNHVSSESHSGHPYGREPHRLQNDSDKNMQWKYDRYTLLMVSCERIYEEYVNIKFWEAGIWPPYFVRETLRADRAKFRRFHKIHNQNIDECIQIKDSIEELIKRHQYDEYMKRSKWDREESPMSKSPSKTTTIGTNGGNKEESKGKHTYIAFIKRRAHWGNLSSKGTTKRKIAEMMVVYRREENTSAKVPYLICCDFGILKN